MIVHVGIVTVFPFINACPAQVVTYRRLAADAQRHTCDAVCVDDPVIVTPDFATIVTILPVAPLAIDISAVVIVINANIKALIIVASL